MKIERKQIDRVTEVVTVSNKCPHCKKILETNFSNSRDASEEDLVQFSRYSWELEHATHLEECKLRKKMDGICE